jgi:putative transposase
MSGQSFSYGAQFRWQRVVYEVVQTLPGGQVIIENVLTGARLVIEMPVLVDALFDGELQFVIEGKQAKEDTQDGISVENAYLDLTDCPERLVAIARYRLEVIRPLLDMGWRTRAAVVTRVQEVKAANAREDAYGLQCAVSVASVYRWIADYTGSGYDLRALIPAVHKRGGKGESRLSPEVETMMETVIRDRYYVREAVTVDDLRDELAVRVVEENHVRSQHAKLGMPSKSTLARRSQDLRTRTLAARQGPRAAKREATQYGQTPYPDLPLERVEIDHTKSDLIVIDDRDNLPLGRLTLTYCLDMATRYPLGYYLGFEPPSYLTVMECLYHTIRPKVEVREQYGTENGWLAYGIPATLVIDNAKEFIGRDLEDACLLLGTVVQHTPVQTPHFKAGVERMFRSLNTTLFHTLPGTTFSNPAARGDYDSAQQACVYLSEVDKMLHIFLVDIYAERFHRGLNGIPARRWGKLTKHGFAPALPPNAEELLVLLGRTTTRVIHHYGIEFMSLRYNCEELVPLRTRLKGKKAKIKYHPADLSCLHVYDPFGGQYIRVPALDQEYTQGLSLWKHRVIRRAVLSERDKVDIVALGRAKRKIQEIVEAGRQRKQQRTRSRIARWDTAGKPTRQVVQESQSKAPGESTTTVTEGSVTLNSPPFATADQAWLSADESPCTDWEISYTSLGHPNDLLKTPEEEGQDG